MNYIIKRRGQGKTYKLIVASEVTGYPILTSNTKRKIFIEDMAREMDCNIPEPMTYEKRSRTLDGLPVEKVLIDDA